MKAYILTPEGEKSEIVPYPREIEGKTVFEPGTFTEEELENVVGGYLDIVALTSDVVMVRNGNWEDTDRPLNVKATELLLKAFSKTTDHILGNVVVCKKNMIQE